MLGHVPILVTFTFNELPIVFLVLTDLCIRPAPLRFKILDTEIKQIIGETGTGTVVTAFFSRYQKQVVSLVWFLLG